MGFYPVNKDEPHGHISIYIGRSDEEVIASFEKPDERVCDEITICEQTIEVVRRLIDVYGKNVTKLSWSGSEISPKEVAEALAKLENLETLELSSWRNFSDVAEVEELKLKHLSSLELGSDCSSDFIEIFLPKVLPKNTLKALDLKSYNFDGNLKEIFSTQKSIKSLTLSEVPLQLEDAVKNLKLEEFVNITQCCEKRLSDTRKFLKSIFSSQVDLKHVELASDLSYDNRVVDDEIFEKISQLLNLEFLYLSVDGILRIGGLQNVKNLKNLQLRSSNEESLDVFRQLTEIKLHSVVELTLDVGYEIPSEVYMKFAVNCPNLKDLTISCGTLHKINFYAKIFPNLERLDVRFGNPSHVPSFEDVFEVDTGIFNYNLKKVEWTIGECKKIDVDDFMEMLAMFPNLEELKMSSSFPFRAEFFEKLNENLNKIKILKLKLFSVKGDEKFPQATSNALRNLALHFLLHFYAIMQSFLALILSQKL